MEPVFVSLAEALEIHQDQVARYGGSMGIRNLDLLKSALAMPAVSFGGEFLHTDIFEMTSANLFHIVNNHPFVDGNKRAGTVTALVFLALNGYSFRAKEDDLAEVVLSVAKGELDKAGLAGFIRRWSSKTAG